MLSWMQSKRNGKPGTWKPDWALSTRLPSLIGITPRRSRRWALTPRQKWIAFVAILLVITLSWSSSAGASEDSEKPAAADGLDAVDLKLGEPAPFAGKLVTIELADELFLAGDTLEDAIRAARRQEAERADIRVDFEKQRYTSLQDARKADQEAFRRQLERERPGWLERPTFVATVSATLTLVTVLIVAAVLGGSERIYAETGP